LGRIGIRESVNTANGYYSFEQTNINTPEIIVLVVIIVYGITYIADKIGSPDSLVPEPGPVYL
jgi:hypothetical protein